MTLFQKNDWRLNLCSEGDTKSGDQIEITRKITVIKCTGDFMLFMNVSKDIIGCLWSDKIVKYGDIFELFLMIISL